MSAGFNPNVFTVFGANFAELERGSHLAVKLVLLLRDLDVVLGGGLHRPAQVGVDASPVGVEVTERTNKSWY